MPNNDQDKVTAASPQWETMRDAGEWELLADLLGGTQTMRAKRHKWTPKNTSESTTNYDARLNRSFLFNGLSDTINKTAAKPFGKPVSVLPENLPESLDVAIKDVDGTSLELTQFAFKVLHSACAYGLTHILVDNPVIPEGLTKEQIQRFDTTTSMMNISPQSLFAWKTDDDGSLSEIRFHETAIVDVGEWQQVAVDQIKVYRKNEILTYRQPNGDQHEDYELIGATGNALGKIPIVTLYTKRDGFMTAMPPFLQLAWINLAHWQSYSDQRNILHFARVPNLFGKGWKAADIDRGLKVGSSNAILVTNENADLKYVEPSGQAISSGRDDLKDLETQMEILGMQPFLQKSINTTATAEGIHESKSQAQIQAWIRACEAALEEAFGLVAEWNNETVPNDFKVDIYSDFVPGLSQSQDMQNLNQAYSIGIISRETWFEEAARRGFVNPDIDIEAATESADQSIAMNTSLEGIGEDEDE